MRRRAVAARGAVRCVSENRSSQVHRDQPTKVICITSEGLGRSLTDIKRRVDVYVLRRLGIAAWGVRGARRGAVRLGE